MSDIEKSIDVVKQARTYLAAGYIKKGLLDKAIVIEDCFDDATQALQEKLERENLESECKYCIGKNYRDRKLISISDSHDFAEIVIDTDNALYISNEDIDLSINTEKILYCPMCGRKLNTDLVNVNKIEHFGEATNMVEPEWKKRMMGNFTKNH